MPNHGFALFCALAVLASCTFPGDSRSPASTGEPTASPGDLNPGRGYYQWRGMQVVPPHKAEAPTPDVYQRFNWSDLQADDGTYTFDAVTALFDAAPDRRVSFRIRSMVDYGSAAAAGAALKRFVPAGIPGWEADTNVLANGNRDGIPDVFIPDWNSEEYLAGVEALFQALADELGSRADRIGWIDVGMFGQYGEWYLRTAPSTSSPASPWVDYKKAPAGIEAPTEFATTEGNPKKRIVDAQLKAFPQARWVMFFLYDQREVLDYVFHHQTITGEENPVGWRFDGLGADQFLEKQWMNSTDKLAWWNGTDTRSGFKDRWKVAPVVCEYYGASADPAEALRQVKAFHIGQVGNGNFTSGGGTDADHWARVPAGQRQTWADVGKEAGWRLKVDSGTWTIGNGTFTWTGRVSNPGNAPAWEPWGAEFRFGSPAHTVQVAIPQAFPLPGESVDLTLTGTLPEGIDGAFTRTWVPTIRGQSAAWTGTMP